MVGAGISKTIFGLARTPLIWLPAQFCSSLNFPLKSSCSDAIWRLKVEPNLQGRVFASRRMFALALSPIAKLIAAPLADYVVEPAMMPGGTLAPLLGSIFGTNPGAGMAFLYVMSSICLVLIGLGGYAFPSLREVEDSVPSGGATTA